MSPTGGDSAIELHAASQKFFGDAGRWRFAQLVFVVCLPTGMAIFGTIHPGHFLIPFAGFVLAVLDATLFNRMIGLARYQAAQLAEQYDAALIVKPPSQARALSCPSPEQIIEAAATHLRRPGRRRDAETWYFGRVRELAFPAAEMLYFRENFAKDEQMRAVYVVILSTIAIGGMVLLVTLAGALDWNWSDFAANVLFPLVPAAAWLGRELTDQNEALFRKTNLRRLLDESLVSSQLRELADQDTLAHEREAIHGLQFMYRAHHPSIPWWLHAWQKNRVQESQNTVMERMVNDASAVAGGLRNPIVAPDTQRQG